MRVVVDTNVVVSALRSKRGASSAVLQHVGTGAFDLVVSVPLVLEYEDVLSRPELNINPDHATAVLDYLSSVGIEQNIWFLWRPFLRDAKDDMVLELAFNGQCSHIVTFNTRDFRDVGQFGITAIPPKDFLDLLKGIHPEVQP
jgi:putative PIN family toxin of toxin-antitoxin system